MTHDRDDEHDDDGPEHDHDPDEGEGEESETELAEMLDGLQMDSQGQVFLEMRGQNLELLKIAAQVAGYGGGHNPLKPNDLRQAMKAIWDVYSEFYEWIDPEEEEEDEEGEE